MIAFCATYILSRHVERIKASPSEQFPRKTGEMSEMPSALHDKRGAPRVSGAVNGKKPLTEEDCFDNSQSLFSKYIHNTNKVVLNYATCWSLFVLIHRKRSPFSEWRRLIICFAIAFIFTA